MKKTVRMISVLLGTAFLFGVITCAPFAAAETQDTAASGENVQPTESHSVTVSLDPMIAEDTPVSDADDSGDEAEDVSESDEEADDPAQTEQEVPISAEKDENIASVGGDFSSAGFECTFIDGGVAVRYYGSDEDVVIPSELNGYQVVAIANNGFYNNRNLKTVTIPNSVKEIGERAFRDCKNLTSVEIPDSVSVIGDYVFYKCSKLTSIEIPASVTSIGSEAFYGCTGLTSVEIPDSVTTIGGGAFYGCTGLTSVTIPNSVTSIGSDAFYGCTGLTSVKIPDSVAEIGERAFRDCKNLTSIEIPDLVTSIEKETFFGCTGLTSVTIPDSVVSIGKGAFSRCTGLTSVEIPKSVTEISNNMFYGCTGLISVTIPDSVTSIGSDAFYGCTGLTSVKIPDSVAEIGERAFRDCKNLTSIEIPDLVTSIEKEIFCGCTGLTSVTIPDSVVSIGEWAFYGCTGLTSVTIPDSVTSIGREAFSSCTGLISVTIPDSVVSIDDATFSYCTGLTSVTIPNSVTSIGVSAFYRCTRLTSVEIPDSVTTIGGGAFKGCTGLTSVTIPKSVTSIDINAFSGCTGLTSIEIPDSVAEIGEGAFRDCTGLTSVTIPDSVTSIGREAFSGCTGLTSVTISDSVKVINYSTFYNCTGLTSVTIPDSVTSIGSSAFSDCTGLTSVTIPNSVTSIGSSAFYGCTGLISVTIPNSVTSIENYAFYVCTGLTSVTIPDSVTSIGSSAFYGCTGLTSVTIPDSVTYIGGYTFYGCTGLTSVTIPNSVTSIEVFTFYGCTGLTSVTIPDSVTSIDHGVFDGCTGLTSVTIPDSVTSIDSGAFYGCTGLTSVTIPDSVISIGERAFSHCTGLTSVTISGSVKKIASYAFYGCTGLTSVTIPNSVTSIGSSAFSGCTGLSSVMIPDLVKKIEYDAFYKCNNLLIVTIPDSVTSISSSAFIYCPDLTIRCNPESYAESFATTNSIPYIYRYNINTGYMRVKANEGLDGYNVRVTGENDALSRTIKDNRAIVYGLESQGSYTVELCSPKGRVIAKREGVTLTDGSTEISFDVSALSNYTVKVVDDSGTEQNDYKVKWFVNGMVGSDSTDNSIKYLNSGDIVRCAVTLGSELKKYFKKPDMVIRTVNNTDETIVIHLERFSRSVTTIKTVDADDRPVFDADVSVVQDHPLTNNSVTSLKTDQNGCAEINLYETETAVRVSKSGYASASWSGVPDGSVVTIKLQDVTGARFAPIVSGMDSDITDALVYDVFNVTQNKRIVTTSFAKGVICVPYESIQKGDLLLFTAKDPEGVYADAQAEVSYTQDSQFFELALTKRGTIRFEYYSDYEENMALIFDRFGSYVATVLLSNGCESDPLPEGTYQVVMMKAVGALFRVDRYQTLLDFGLSGGRSFQKQTVTVTDGEISYISDVYIPNLDESMFLLTDPENTYVVANPAVITQGASSTLTVNYQIPAAARGGLTPKSVEITIPDGFSAGNTIVINGKKTQGFETADGILRIPVTAYEGKIAVSLSTNIYYDSTVVCASLNLKKNNKEISQPIGTAVLTMQEDFFVPKTTAAETITVSGNVSPRSDVTVYVDAKPQKTIRASQMGFFKTDVMLSDVFSHTYHSVYFEISDAEGNTYKSQRYNVEYDVNMIYVDSISMSPNGMYGGSVKLYSADGNYSSAYYYWPGKYDTITYTVTFAGNADCLSDVVLISKSSSGSSVSIPLTRINETNTFSGKYQYETANFPDEISVSYETELNDMPFDAAYAEEISREFASCVSDLCSDLNELEEAVAALSDSDKAIIEEVNAECGADLENAIDSLSSTVNSMISMERVDDSEYLIKSAISAETYCMKSWTDSSATEQQLLAKGYQKVSTYNSADRLYTLTTPTSHTLADLDTGEFMSVEYASTGSDIAVTGADPTWRDYLIQAAADLQQQELEAGRKIDDAWSIIGYCETLINVYLNLFKGKINDDLIDLDHHELGKIFNKLRKALSGLREFTDILEDVRFFNKELLDNLLADYYRAELWWQDIYEQEQDTGRFCPAANADFQAAIDNIKVLTDIKNRFFWCVIGQALLFASNGLDSLSKTLRSIPREGQIIQLDIDLNVDVAKINMRMNTENLKHDARVCQALIDENFRQLASDLVDCLEPPYNQPKKKSGNSSDPRGPKVKPRKILDPSGFVYEAVESNRLSGVTVTAYYSQYSDGRDAQIWEAEDFDQNNPLVTNAMGQYEWYVPDGYWQVKYEKEGYETTYSDWLPVPPPQMDVNIGMVSTNAPEVKDISVYDDCIDITFSQYMLACSLTSSNVVVTSGDKVISGRITAENGGYNADGEKLAERFRFVPDSNVTLSGDVKVDIKSVCNYANYPIEEPYSSTQTAQARVKSISCDENVKLYCGNPTTMKVELLPKEAAAGKSVTVSVDNETVLSVAQDLAVADENGIAEFELTAKLPGAVNVTFTQEGTVLSASAAVNCVLLSSESVELERVASSVPSGSIVPKGVKVKLSNANPDAQIYYTLDMSCPCQVNNPARVLYTGPITVSENMNLIAYAVLDGYEESKTILYSYTVSEDSFILGDTDGSDEVEAVDATFVQRYLVNIDTPYNKAELLRGDADGSGELELLDVTAIQYYLANMKTPFTIGKSVS